MPFRFARIAASLAVLLLPVVTTAQAPQAGPPTPPQALARRVTAAPVLDGKLDDVMWKGLPLIEGFRQREPMVGAPATEASTVRIGYDNTHLYVGAHLADSTPDGVRASELRRDNTLELRVQSMLRSELPLEPELERWYAVWDAPTG